ncbi:MAG: DNA adenine methylase [Pirellulaceae bacterium]
MQSVTPLRYPGGKTALADTLRAILERNNLEDFTIVEPFAGGGGASLALLFEGAVKKIVLNDLDDAIAAFWWAATHRHNIFRERVQKVPLTVAQWKKQRKKYRDLDRSRFDRGFAAFYLNRCNRSGIIKNGGCIGGLKQDGDWALDARFTRSTLIQRLDRIAEFRKLIRIRQHDARRVIRTSKRERRFFFIDPPYYHKGQELYLNSLNHEYHKKLADHLKSLDSSHWVVTYDDCPEIRKLYRDWANIRRYSLRYTAAVRRRAGELLITPKGLIVPMSASRSMHWA